MRHRFQPALDIIARQSAALKAANWGCFPRSFSVIEEAAIMALHAAFIYRKPGLVRAAKAPLSRPCCPGRAARQMTRSAWVAGDCVTENNIRGM